MAEPSPTPQEPLVPSTATLATSAPPAGTGPRMSPEEVEFYVRAAMNQDRTPGNLLVVCHPFRMYKVPRGLFGALRKAGWTLEVVETQADRVASVRAIREALVRLSKEDKPLDLMVVSGDGTMDHHVLVACFWAFYPDLVSELDGKISVGEIPPDELESLPGALREALLSPLPTGEGLAADDPTITDLWLLREALEPHLQKGRSPARIARAVGRPPTDPLLRLGVLATLLPHRVTLQRPGFDLSGLANADRDTLYRGLYPFLRSLVVYPAGTAADNAVFAGTPGWGYAQVAGLLKGSWLLGGVRRALERIAIRRFLHFFTQAGVVVPERISLVGFDGTWQTLSSHAVGGPGSGHFFTADLRSKTKGLLGYLALIPRVLVREGILGSTLVQVRSMTAEGKTRSFTEARLAEGLYTNRAFIGGVGSVPTTGPTSFAGQSSLVLVPPIWYRAVDGRRLINLRGVAAFAEGFAKGLLGRALHRVGLSPGHMAGDGKFAMLLPEHQVAIKEGEEISMRYLTRDKRPRAVPVQVSGDPFQACETTIQSSWAPLPVLGHASSLLLKGTRAALADARLQQSFHLQKVYIGGVHYFRHQVGEPWSSGLQERTGLVPPPHFLGLSLAQVQRRLVVDLKERGAGEFVDTTKVGLDLGRGGRYAHNHDLTAHLVVKREHRSFLLVRQLRAQGGGVFESRARYRLRGASWIIDHSETLEWRKDAPPLLLQEDHFFRNAEEFRQDALGFFPVETLARSGAPPQDDA